MNYVVQWLPAARRSAVTQASHLIDLRLQRFPEESGESRPDGLRIYFESPLGVLFRIRPGTLVVEVIHVWEFEV
jgi:hypothetical protein